LRARTPRRSIGVELLGTGFMAETHSNAFLQFNFRPVSDRLGASLFGVADGGERAQSLR
jgi:hypothetical protein